MLIFDFGTGGSGGGSSGKKTIVKSDIMPEAGGKYEGEIYIYAGETNETYTHGYIYECVDDVQVERVIALDPVGSEIHKLAFDYVNHDVLELFQRIASLSTPTFDPADVVTGSLRLDKINELWYISGKDANGDALFSDFTVGGTGDEYSLDAYGYIYLYLFADEFEDGHEEEFLIMTGQQDVYGWQRLDVQPSMIDPEGVPTVDTPDGTNKDAIVNVEYVDKVVGTIETALSDI